MKELLEILCEKFTSDIVASEMRPGVWNLHIGVYYDDGDEVEVFVEKNGDDTYRFSDKGSAITRTEDTSEDFARKVKSTPANVEDDEIFIDAKLNDAPLALLNISHAAKSAAQGGSRNNETEKPNPGRHLKHARKLAGFTLEEVAEKIGVAPEALASWENGDSRMPFIKWMELFTVVMEKNKTDREAR
jgi:DNA-binding XRE family transcriptional regulator